MKFEALHQAISNVATRFPDKIAIDWGDEKVSYSQLEDKSNQIANFFYSNLKENKNVPIMLRNSSHLVQTMLGLLKCGGIFVPLDPEFPENRIKVMINEVEGDWIVTRSIWLEKLDKLMKDEKRTIKALVLDGHDSKEYENIEIFRLDNIPKESQLPEEVVNKYCYIYFTSGSTGKPKAILGRHRSLKHFVDWEIEEFGIDEDFNISQLVTPSFDAILRDLFVPLCAGGTICIPRSKEVVVNPEALIEWIEEKEINLMHMVPTLFKALMSEVDDPESFKELKYILLAGEMLRGSDIKKFFELFGQRVQLINLYGTTETTLVKLFYRVQESDVNRVSVPVGRPMSGAQAMILDEDMQSCGVESIGEVYIRTPFISAGYYKNKEATREVFLKNPFTDNPRDVIYKTGDLGRMLSDGNIEILGRRDNQVKLRGVRIELGEIENQLLQFNKLKEAVAVALEEDDTKYLSAYAVAKGDKPKEEELRQFLQERLPDYMIPTYFVLLDSLPLTPNGKIDRKALPKPGKNIETEYIPPENQLQEQLAEIWAEVLRLDQVGITHNFFSLGGHSLKAARLVARIHQELEVELSLKDVFVNPTIKKMAKLIQQSEKEIHAGIEPVEKREYYPVTSAQRRLFVLDQLEGQSIAYNMPRVMEVEGPLDKDRLEASLKQIIERHETLRTSFGTVDGDIIQRIEEEIDFSLDYLEADESQLERIIDDFVCPFNLEHAPLLRAKLVKIDEEKYIFLFDTHHIISDGVSQDILIREFISHYQGQELPDLRIQYKDYTVWQNQQLEGGLLENQEEYWLDRFAGEIPVLNMPTDYPRPKIQSFEGDTVAFRIGKELTAKLNNLAKETGSTLYMVLLAAYNALLARYTGQEDIVVGSPIAGRPDADLQNLIGMFINTLAMRNFPENGLSFKEFLNQVKDNALKAYENQDYQFERLVKELGVPRDMSRNPIFNTLFTLHNTDNENIELEGLTFKPYGSGKNISKFDLSLSAEEFQDAIAFNWEYCTKLFKRETMEELSDHLINLLQEIADNPEIELGEIDILTEEEKEEVLANFNQTQLEYPRDKRWNQLFEEQAARTPDKIALVCGNDQLTYQELNARANQIARGLQEKGVKQGSIVGLILERSVDMIAGLIGVLKAGGAYLPMDPEYPQDRIKYMLEDSGTEILVTEKFIGGKLTEMNVDMVCVDDEEIYQNESRNLDLIGTSEDIAYLIYTSGSTGKPKGVMVEHHPLNNFIYGIADLIDFAPEKSILALTTISFDIFGLETLLPLIRGLKVVIATEEEQKDTRALGRVIRMNNIDMLQMTPSRMKMLMNDENNVKCLEDVQEIMVGGEAFPETLLGEIRKVTDAKVYNMYGPTETTIWSSVKDLSTADEITIGRPIANTAIHIVNKSGKLQPVGVGGELCIAGDGLARGYLNRPDLTDDKFVPNPYTDKEIPVTSQKMYRTGDLARWQPDGEIEFLGRIDHQVKVRGYRIEPGEIESRLAKHEAILETVVVARKGSSNDKYLCAYLVSVEELEVKEIKEYLSADLPDYMIPSYFIQIDEMPYTPNGKIDRKGLPEPEGDIVTGVEYVPPTNEIEEKLVEIWEEVLGIDKIGINHNFFEIGGNSINIIKVISLINKEFTGVQIPMSELFLRPTIAEVANNLFTEDPLNDLDCIVRLNKPVEGRKNMFIIHNREGIIYQYKELAKLLEGDYNFYGIQARGLLKREKLPETIEDMVTDYICEMKAVQPEGPYIIGGFCYGNWLAYIMVQMLEEKGVDIEKLLLIDENVLIAEKFVKFLQAKSNVVRPLKFTRNAIRKVTQGRKNPMDYWPDLEEYRKSKEELPEDFINERTVKENINYLCEKTMTQEIKDLVRSDIFVIKAEENNLERFSKEAWSNMTYGKVSFVEIPGTHDNLFSHPYVERLAEEIKEELD